MNALKSLEWKALTEPEFALGESPFWHPQEQSLYWVDIPRSLVCRLADGAPASAVRRWAMPSDPGCIAPLQGGGLVLALRDGIYVAKAWEAPLTRVAALPYDPASIRANDGKCDALGRLWVGTIDEPKSGHRAALFCIDGRGAEVRVTQHAANALTGNGVAWSPDLQHLYWADTPNHVVHRWTYQAEGPALSHHERWLELPGKPDGWTWQDLGYAGRPDGSAVDVEGHYWAAMFEGRRVCRFAPDGTCVASYEVPAQCPTMPCFGGPDGRTLYLTTARKGRSDAELSAMPLSGAVFSTRVAVGGAPVNSFRYGV